MKIIDELYFAKEFNEEKSKHLFKLLKRDFYYENVNLYGRLAVAEFETEGFEKGINQFVKVINNNDKSSRAIFSEWLSDIEFRLLPKKVKLPSEINTPNRNTNEGKSFISNLRTSKKYYLEEVNYFADMPVQLLLLSMLWSITVGVILDRKLLTNSLGHRLNLKKGEDFNENTFNAFKFYLPDYNKWRDKAIKVGLKNLESKKDILLVAMDIKQCFYFLKTDWENISDQISKTSISNPEKNFCKKITKLLAEVHLAYFSKAKKFLEITHYSKKDLDDNQVMGLPIGLPSSRILANWELDVLDKKIKRKLSPAYYGRYVDDFLIVLRNPDRKNLSPEGFIKGYFIDTNIFQVENTEDEKEKTIYKILGKSKKDLQYEHLEIQKEKLGSVCKI